jgi:hypothetical protein
VSYLNIWASLYLPISLLPQLFLPLSLFSFALFLSSPLLLSIRSSPSFFLSFFLSSPLFLPVLSVSLLLLSLFLPLLSSLS